MDCLLAFSFSFIICFITPSAYGNECNEMATCTKCIQRQPNCSWCEDENFVFAKCDDKEVLKGKRCKSIQIPQPTLDKKKDLPLSNPGADVGHMVQLKPQQIRLAVRPGETFKFEVQFRQAEDYPVDLYSIMDLSYTMLNHKRKLASLGKQLAAEMSKITKNFRLGFGAFVEKVVLPFTSTNPILVEKPCAGCARPFGFKNVMPLSNKTDQFQALVDSINTSGNLDSPEGGLDALMQATVCEKPIAWRDVSRKLIVFSTDAGYHIAGDGKLAGIVKPNDGRCHLDDDGLYTASLTQDYPSIGHLNGVVSEKKVHIIFAVTDGVITTYEQLASRLEGAGVGKLSVDANNIVQLIRDHYNKISSTVILKDDLNSDDVRVSYYTRCLNPARKLVKNNTCDNLKVGTTVTFEVHVDVKQCPKDKKDWSRVFRIWPQGIDEELLVQLDLLCDCDCEKSAITASDKCAHGNGTFVCGICRCNPKRYGSRCECGITDTAASEDDKACYKDNTSLPCSGVGQCVCGMCDCSLTLTGNHDRPLSGKFCECDDSQCPAPNGVLCSGNGRCDCGACKCDFLWVGEACDCPSPEACVPPSGQSLCSGKGECKCGQCECHQTEEGTYIGKYCEVWQTYSEKCETYWRCVICQDHFNGPRRELCQGFNCSNEVHLVDNLEALGVNQNERFCVQTDSEDYCKVSYKYGKIGDNDDYYIFVQKTKQCQEEAPIALIAGSVIGGVVAIGIVTLLIWKLLTTVHDRKEYAKFENERTNARWDKSENPLYKPSTTEFRNPTYPE